MFASAEKEETLLDIARLHDIGQEEILLANPTVDRWLPGANTPVLIPSRFILPDAPRNGLTLNLPEMRIYHFRPLQNGKKEVTSYPVSIGRMDWKTPLGTTRIIRKQKNPAWHPPDSVRQEAADAGEEVPDMVPPGPENPLGAFALRLNLPGYLLHGTNKPYGVGMRVTHGCVRLLPEDIEDLFGRVEVGTEVHLVNQPVKLGWEQGTLYLEVHPPMEEDSAAQVDLLQYALELIYQELELRPATLLGREIRRAVTEKSGIPVAISTPGQRPPIQINSPLFD